MSILGVDVIRKTFILRLSGILDIQRESTMIRDCRSRYRRKMVNPVMGIEGILCWKTLRVPFSARRMPPSPLQQRTI